MRTSTRVRNALIGIVSATALTGGALAATAAPASAATRHGRSEEIKDEPGAARKSRRTLNAPAASCSDQSG